MVADGSGMVSAGKTCFSSSLDRAALLVFLSVPSPLASDHGNGPSGWERTSLIWRWRLSFSPGSYPLTCSRGCKLSHANYTASATTEDINTAHYQLFCARRGKLESSQLAPCEDCLFLHAMRANYQAGIWRGSLQQHPQVPSPVEHGWVRDVDGQLTLEWMRGSPAPEAVLQLLSCNCSRRCKLPECPCMSIGLKSTILCKLQTCDNQPQDDDLDMLITDADLTDSESEDDLE